MLWTQGFIGSAYRIVNDREEILTTQDLIFSLYNTMQPFSVFVDSLSCQPQMKNHQREWMIMLVFQNFLFKGNDNDWEVI